MTWNDTTYEKAMKAHFIKHLDDVTKGNALYSRYTSVRDAMKDDNFFGEIKGQEPDLSDHSERHIQDVFERTYKVIGEKEFDKLDVYEVYCLALMVLFHDVGNIYGRVGHDSQGKIAEIYNNYRTKPSDHRVERRIITNGASAHSGKNKNGKNDTLKDINDDSLYGNKIRLQELSSILRFADELAEGKQRTCSFLIERGLYIKGSQIYHNYAQITEIEIDRQLERISIKYDIDIPKCFNQQAQEDLKKLILFTYYRAVKLDIERRYTKYYSKVLQVFSYVVVQYNFSYDGIPIDIDLGKIVFEDKYPIPGEEPVCTKEGAKDAISQINKNYDIENVLSIIKQRLE